MNAREYQEDPGMYALDLAQEGVAKPIDLLKACLCKMQPDDIQNVLARMALTPDDLRLS